MKAILVVSLAVILSGVVFYFIKKNQAPYPPPAKQETVPVAMQVEPNLVMVTEQQPGAVVNINMVELAAPGFVAVQEDMDGQLGTVLGASSLLQKGENLNVPVPLATSTTDGQKLHAVLYSDTNGDGIFNASTDGAVPSSLGGPMESIFDVSLTASTGTPISI